LFHDHLADVLDVESDLAPDVVATGNPGCMIQIAAAAAREGHRYPVVHPIQLVDASIRALAAPHS